MEKAETTNAAGGVSTSATTKFTVTALVPSTAVTSDKLLMVGARFTRSTVSRNARVAEAPLVSVTVNVRMVVPK